MRLDPVAPASRRAAIGIRVGTPGAAGDQGIQEPCNEHLTPISILVGLVPIVTKAIFLQVAATAAMALGVFGSNAIIASAMRSA
jgi:hypothetical protein